MKNVSSSNVRPKAKSRQVLALDIAPMWKKAFEEVVLPQYPDEQSVSSLLRRIIQETVSCFLTEKEMRDRGLLAPYRSLGNPDALLFALRRAEELRKETAVHNAIQSAQSESDLRGKRTKAS